MAHLAVRSGTTLGGATASRFSSPIAEKGLPGNTACRWQAFSRVMLCPPPRTLPYVKSIAPLRAFDDFDIGSYFGPGGKFEWFQCPCEHLMILTHQ